MKRSFIAVTPGQLHREIELMRELHHLKPCVIVDEAPLLDREMLEEMRFLLNVRMDSESPMALMLVGQSELWDRLRMQAYTAIRQRIDVQCRLLHYDRAQTGNISTDTLATQQVNRRSSRTARWTRSTPFPVNGQVNQQDMYKLPHLRCGQPEANYR